MTETPLGCSSYHKASAKAFTACLLMAYTPVEATETKELTEHDGQTTFGHNEVVGCGSDHSNDPMTFTSSCQFVF